MMDSLEAIESQRELALENDARGELRSLVFWAIPALIDKIRRTEAALANAIQAGRGLSSLIDDNVQAERERCLAVVRWVRALYPETAFPPDSDSRDAISGTWARKVCDNIVAQIEEAE